MDAEKPCNFSQSNLLVESLIFGYWYIGELVTGKLVIGEVK